MHFLLQEVKRRKLYSKNMAHAICRHTAQPVLAIKFTPEPVDFCFCSESVAQNQHEAIQGFIQGTIAEKAPVVPISAQLKYNVDAVCEYIVRRIPVPVRDFTSPPQMIVIRSFDVNKPGSEVEDLQGGVAGGSILQVTPHSVAGEQAELSILFTSNQEQERERCVRAWLH